MKIIIIDSSGNRIFIEVKGNDTIRELHKKYSKKIGNYQEKNYHFNGEILEFDETIDSYDICENSFIYVLGVFKGGETGSSAKSFVDPTIKGPTRVKTTYEGPFYLTVTYGINLFGHCYNPKCDAHKLEVCHRFGYGTFDLIKDFNPESPNCPKCPACETPLLKLDTCGFMQCKYHYIGKKVENDKIEKVNYEKTISKGDDEIDYFSAGKDDENKSLWIELKITASKI